MRQRRHRFNRWVGKIPWRRAWQPTLVFLPGEPHGQRSLAGYSPWGCRVGHSWSNLTCMQAHYIYCAFYFYYYYISSTSDHQTLDPGGWGPCLRGVSMSDTPSPCPLFLPGPWGRFGQNPGLLVTQSVAKPGVLGQNDWISFFFFFNFCISWRLTTLQYCSGFCHTLKWISHGFTCVPHPDPPSHLPLHPIPLGLPSVPGPSTCLMHPTWAGDLFHPW